MNRKLSENILKVLNERAKPSSLKDLRARGYRNISLLRLADLNGLIRDAVNRTLRDAGVRVSPQMLRIQGDRVRGEFLRLLSERDDLKETTRRLEGELDELRGNWQRLDAGGEADQERLRREEQREIRADGVALPGERLQRLEEEIRERLWDQLRNTGVDKAVANRAVATAIELIDRERELAYRGARAEQEERVDQLRRRLNKLKSKLAETERILTRVQEAAESGEPAFLAGTAPEMGEPGLDEADRLFREKQEALRQIFEINVELKKLFEET